MGSLLGTAGLNEQLVNARPDALLEQLGAGDLNDLADADFPDSGFADIAFANDGKLIPRVALVAEADYTTALAAIQAADPALQGASRGILRGILPVWASETEIRSAILAVAQGLLVLHPDIVEHAGSPPATMPQSAGDVMEQPLSPRETEILNLLAAGLGNKEIAWQLKISEHTVKFHVTSIFNKLSASTRAEAVAVGMRRGLIIL
ncbi:MAG TPA: response regulator transcription factor [Candidatus Acidoferrales bacterium]